MTVQTWIANELCFTAQNTYENPFEEVTLDAVFTCGRKKMTVPAFWDGGSCWKVRFSLPAVGLWQYKLVCSHADAGLSGEGTVECEAYTGEYEIYRRGFLKTTPNLRYFTYADGTPFFYLGDTHWGFATEELDEAGPHAGDLKIDSHFGYIVERRAQQGFTVYQSEPIGAKYHLGDGLTEEDLVGFRDLDRRFACIAAKGLVHANAQLDFPSTLVKYERYGDTAYLKKLARYWAARYSAYPCLWTLGQEVDNDFYYVRGDQRRFQWEDNPFKIIGEALYAADPHKHPLSAHMEFTNTVAGPGLEGTCPSTSAFREVKGHTWYAYQWNRNLGQPVNYEFAKDGIINGQGKPCILYESFYDYLWTKHFGARCEGWMAFLNGMYGYGYGAIDMWLYQSKYDIENPSHDGYEEISPADKQVHWSESIEFETVAQLQHMKAFLQKLPWWQLAPRFDSKAWFQADGENYHSIATIEKKLMVLYFANMNSYATGTLVALERGEYTYQWFDPRTGEYLPEKPFQADQHRCWKVENKPTTQDWVLLIKKR